MKLETLQIVQGLIGNAQNEMLELQHGDVPDAEWIIHVNECERVLTAIAFHMNREYPSGLIGYRWRARNFLYRFDSPYRAIARWIRRHIWRNYPDPDADIPF